jgi:hypothetical protein
MRNVLKEFLERRHGQRKPTILGLREHIFTGRLVMSLIINWILMSVNGNDEGHSAEKHCRFFFFFSACVLILYPCILQCFITCMVHVQSGDQFCNYWATNFGKSSQVSVKFSSKSNGCLCDLICIYFKLLFYCVLCMSFFFISSFPQLQMGFSLSLSL